MLVFGYRSGQGFWWGGGRVVGLISLGNEFFDFEEIGKRWC